MSDQVKESTNASDGRINLTGFFKFLGVVILIPSSCLLLLAVGLFASPDADCGSCTQMGQLIELFFAILALGLLLLGGIIFVIARHKLSVIKVSH